MQCLTIKKVDSEIDDRLFTELGLDRCEFFDLEVTDLDDRWEIQGEMSSLQAWKLDCRPNVNGIIENALDEYQAFILSFGAEPGEA